MGLNIESKFQQIDFDLQSFLWNKKENSLDLLKELVQLMNGQIAIQNVDNQGATFMVTIPSTSTYTSTITHPHALLSDRVSIRKNTFLTKLQTIIEENIEDDTFGIPQLCQAACLSRSQLHNKIKAATGISTSIYIRNIRLKKAKHLLEHSDRNISEVAYEVGFKDPSYFSRLFTERYGITPRGIRNL